MLSGLRGLDFVISESLVGCLGAGSRAQGGGLPNKVPWWTLILQFHCLPRLRTQEGGEPIWDKGSPGGR